MISINKKFKLSLIIVITAVAITIYVIVTDEEIVGGIVYFEEKNALKYLAVTTKNSDRWIFPKGKVKFYEFKEQAAIREVTEEAGVNVKIIFKLDGNPFIYQKQSGKLQNIDLYVMKYLSEVQIWKERNDRNRKWVTFSEGKSELSPEFTRALKESQNRLKNY